MTITAKEDNVPWGSLLCVYVLGALFTFTFIQRHSGLDKYDRHPASVVGAIVWPVYWAGYGALGIDEDITEMRKPAPPPTCVSEDGSQFPGENFGKYVLCRAMPKKESVIPGAVLPYVTCSGTITNGLIPFVEACPSRCTNGTITAGVHCEEAPR